MSEAFAVPGVYVEESNALALSIQSGETAVPVLVGHFNALDSSLTGCVPVESWLAFTKLFRVVDPITIDVSNPAETKVPTAQCGAHSVRLYFENGGGPCYVLNLPDRTEKSLTAMVAAIEQCPDITLLVWCEHVDDAKVYEQLGTLLGASATSGGNRGMFLLADAQATDATNKTFIAPTLTEPTQVATYFPALLTNYVREWSDQDVKVTGLDSEIQVTMMQLSISDSELNEPTLDTLKLTIANLTSWADPSENKALEAAQTAYAKCRELATKLAEESNPVILRASVAMAGVMARVDRERGVWKAPANVGLVGVQDLISLPQTGQAQLIRIDDTLNTTLVDSKINAIRSFRGQGVMVWGAHTMSDPKQTAWRYIPVRRLFNTVERDARATLRTVVFEPNSAPTWEAVRGALDHYLHALWRQGALQGDTPAQAYFVQIGLGTTMTQEDITNGRMIVKVGLAAVRPAEFIVLQLTQDVATA